MSRVEQPARAAVALLCAAAITLAGGRARASGPDSAAGDRTPVARTVELLDVPYVPQGRRLCGGAALAMVLRYWGARGVLAGDFASLVDPRVSGIRAERLAQAVRDSGWTALPFSGTPGELQDHLAHGRPLIVLLRTGSTTNHYVVVVGWAGGRVVVHDPVLGPYRPLREKAFLAKWSRCDNWALLVLRPPGSAAADALPQDGVATDSAPAAAAPGSKAVGASSRGARPNTPPEGCGPMVETAVLLARNGDPAGAELALLKAESMFPDSAAPVRERAGLRFRAEDWEGASRLARQALQLDPDDPHAWRLLAGSRFLLGDVDGALRAWNHLSEPRADLTRIDGLVRTRYSAVAGQVDLPAGRLVTPNGFRRARRRLSSMPAQSASRLELRPEPRGTARIDVSLLERPSIFDGPYEAGRAAITALLDREIAVHLTSPTGNGELWTASWRWWTNRPRLSLGLAMPAGGGPGIWRAISFWERQTYAADVAPKASPSEPAASGAALRVEERRRTSLAYSDWLGPDVRVEGISGHDRWLGRGSFLSLGGSVETRWTHDRMAVGAGLERWVGLSRAVPFGTAGLSLDWNSAGIDRDGRWLLRVGLSAASRNAPLALWSGAGTGRARAPLLRAHPLLDGGVIRGRTFGRALLNGSIERRSRAWNAGPLRAHWALFADCARPWHPLRRGPSVWQLDLGSGLRLSVPGLRGELRVDAAHGLRDGSTALSAGWRVP